ncbi:MAG TPA: ATP-binding protein [Cyclobacteriaceae bacterium]|nr:ATP-binding protein [Cyclobacteriaceae bacterium]
MNKLQESSVYNPEQVQELKKLVARGEGLTLEFKRKATNPEKIVREMIAFANTQGGVLLVGIGDDKTIPGLKFPEDESYVIQQALKNCKPGLLFTETFIPIGDNRIVIQYDIPESTRKPHTLLLADNVKECYVRAEDMSIKASREVREIIQRAQKKKDIKFYYGEYETLLMKYLDENSSITLKQFMEVAKLNRFRASKKLVLLVLANVLRVTPGEKGDVYSLAFHQSPKKS